MNIPRHCAEHPPGFVALDYGYKLAVMCPCGKTGPVVDMTGRHNGIEARLAAISLWSEAVRNQSSDAKVELP